MYEKLIMNYIANLDEYTIQKYATSNDIVLNDEEVKTILIYIKNYWQVFYKEDPTYLFKELEEKINKDALIKIKDLYYKYITKTK